MKRVSWKTGRRSLALTWRRRCDSNGAETVKRRSRTSLAVFCDFPRPPTSSRSQMATEMALPIDADAFRYISRTENGGRSGISPFTTSCAALRPGSIAVIVCQSDQILWIFGLQKAGDGFLDGFLGTALHCRGPPTFLLGEVHHCSCDTGAASS